MDFDEKNMFHCASNLLTLLKDEDRDPSAEALLSSTNVVPLVQYRVLNFAFVL